MIMTICDCYRNLFNAQAQSVEVTQLCLVVNNKVLLPTEHGNREHMMTLVRLTSSCALVQHRAMVI